MATQNKEYASQSHLQFGWPWDEVLTIAYKYSIQPSGVSLKRQGCWSSGNLPCTRKKHGWRPYIKMGGLLSWGNKVGTAWVPVTVDHLMSLRPIRNHHQISTWARNKLLSCLTECCYSIYVFLFCGGGGGCFYSEPNINLTEKASKHLVSLENSAQLLPPSGSLPNSQA